MSLKLRKLDRANSEECKFMEQLYIASFPPSERRSLEEMHQLYNADSPFVIDMILKEDETPLGFITHWDFDNFIYAEHFAITSTERNAGYGRKSVELFLTKYNKTVILEAELPTDEMSTRRIGFYTRLGFRLWDHIEYAQPNFVKGEADVPMHLLTVGKVDLDEPIDYDNIVKTLFRIIYKKEL